MLTLSPVARPSLASRRRPRWATPRKVRCPSTRSAVPLPSMPLLSPCPWPPSRGHGSCSSWNTGRASIPRSERIGYKTVSVTMVSFFCFLEISARKKIETLICDEWDVCVLQGNTRDMIWTCQKRCHKEGPVPRNLLPILLWRFKGASKANF